MTVGIGLGLSNYTFSTAECYWDWVHMCDDEGVRLPVADRPSGFARALP